MRGAQPGHQTPPVPESRPAQRGTAGVLLGVALAVHRLLGLVRPPGAQRQVPQQPGQRGGHRGREGEPAAGRAPPAAVRHHRRQEAQPGVAFGARARARALPGDEVEGDLAGGGDQEHRQGEAGEPQQQPVEADRADPAAGGGPHPVGDVDDHEGQEQQPQGAGAVAGGEVAPDVGLGHRPSPVVLGAGLGVGVLGAPEDGRDVVAGDPHGPGVVQHLGGRRAAHSVHQEFQGGAALPGRPGLHVLPGGPVLPGLLLCLCHCPHSPVTRRRLVPVRAQGSPFRGRRTPVGTESPRSVEPGGRDGRWRGPSWGVRGWDVRARVRGEVLIGASASACRTVVRRKDRSVRE